MWPALWTQIKAALPKNWQAILFSALISLAAAALTAFLHTPAPLPAPPIPEPVWTPGPDDQGWVPDPEAVRQVRASLKVKSFADTPAGKSDDPLPASVFLWDAYRQKYGKLPPSRDQGGIGSCVSFGTTTAVERTMIVDIVLKGAQYDYYDTVQENVYGGSRVQVGGGRLRGDGSVGAWAAQYVQKWGVVKRQVYDLAGKSYDLQTYSVALCRQWGNSGVPSDIQTVAKEHPVQSITQVLTWDSAKKALAQGYGIAICSGQGFSMKRDANGVARPQGSWAHCMALDGYTVQNGKEYGHIENSWGPNRMGGPVGWGDPPTSGFWADSATVARMLAQKDSWAFSTVKGFPKVEIDWFVLHRRQSDAMAADHYVPFGLSARLGGRVFEPAQTQGFRPRAVFGR